MTSRRSVSQLGAALLGSVLLIASLLSGCASNTSAGSATSSASVATGSAGPARNQTPSAGIPVKGDAASDVRVLVVDDYATMRRIFRNLLTQLGYTSIDEAADGATALQKLRSERYSVVISDWNMEPMTGLQLLKEVRADTGLSSIPFLMVTAESKSETVVAVQAAGASNYVVRPFNAETLRQKLSQLGVGLPRSG